MPTVGGTPWQRNEVVWDRYLARGIRTVYPPGDIIYMAGYPSDHLYYLRQGRVRVTLTHEDGSEKVMSIQEGQTLMGESAFFDGKPHFATITAVLETEVYAFPTRVVMELIAADPEISLEIMRSLGRKMRILAAQVASLTFLDARRRVVYLLDQLTGLGEDSPTLNITHQELASIAGLNRVTVTEVLNELAQAGCLSKGKSRITITDRQALLKFR